MSDKIIRTNYGSLDGIRRPVASSNHRRPAMTTRNTPPHRVDNDVDDPSTTLGKGKPTKASPSLNNDIKKSLAAIEDQPIDGNSDLAIHHKRRATKSAKAGKRRKKWSTKKKVIVGIISFILIALIAVGIYAYMMLGKVSTIFKGSPTDILTPVKLKEDTTGRTNVLIFGTSEDDEGHRGAMLADSIMVLSINQNNSDVAMFSVPRDLWVSYGMNCSNGTAGKVNATYICALQQNNNDAERAGLAFANVVSGVFNLQIPYYVKVDYGAIKSIVDALGGVDVNIYSADSRGIYDVQTKLKLPAGVNHLDGQTALTLARARNSKGGYGLPRSNFDRENNQQRILQAIQKKALSVGVLANPQKALDILNSLGENVSTNISMSELRQLLDVALGLGDKEMRSIDINDQLKTGRVGAASTVLPKAGQGNYAQLQQYVAEQLAAGNAPASNGESNGQTN